MKSSPKDLALATLSVARTRDMKTAAKGLFKHLQKHHLIKLVPQILVELNKAEELSGQVTAKVYSANKINDSELSLLKSKIKKMAAAEKVEINNIIDKSLIGGLKITFQDKIIDQTLKNRVNLLRIKLSKLISS